MSPKRLAAALLVTVLVPTLSGSAEAPFARFDQGHAAWSALLERRVHDGSVDYAGLKRSDTLALDAYLKSLGQVSRTEYEGWSRQEKTAYWINAYNAFTIRLVLDHYPIESIRSIGLLPLAAFRDRFISLPGLRNERYSLNEIENDVLRGELHGEPRIHFAIVCASKGCPKLWSEAYRGADLDAQLDRAARAFLTDPSRNRLDPGKKRLHLSSIFEWYRKDFEEGAGSLLAFVGRYVAPKPPADVRVEFLDYDWSLNGR